MVEFIGETGRCEIADIRPERDRPAREAALAKAVSLLQAGQLVAVPTETVYGLAGDATNAEAVAAIYATKGRPAFNPLILHCASTEHARELGDFNRQARMLADAFWPGPLTLVVPRRLPGPIADLATAGLDSVALRVTRTPVMRELSNRVGAPLAAPSANLSGRLTPTSAEAVAEQLGDRLPLILDGGATAVGVESTVVACLGTANAALLRPGGVTAEAIEACLGAPLDGVAASGGPIRSPGATAIHYAPATSVRIDAETVHDGEAVLLFGKERPAGIGNAVAVENLSPSGDLAEAAANLFAMLRALDGAGAKAIAVVPVPERGLGAAINDRLRRAAQATG